MKIYQVIDQKWLKVRSADLFDSPKFNDVEQSEFRQMERSGAEAYSCGDQIFLITEAKVRWGV